ncbi:MAG: Holliday junction resolvase RuvX [Candidatus Kaiserbacteria bacterium]|nr:Holliday junction resolvase RuvX [Candidatus Kaiserbacteria bacterium]
MTKYLGIDYGAKRIGIAVSNDEGTIAFPRATIKNDAQVFESLTRIIADEKVQSIIIGDTRSFSNLANSVTKEAEDFAKRLKKETSLPVERVWEAGSSIEASRYAPEGENHSDGAAAAIILQRFLDTQGDKLQ